MKEFHPQDPPVFRTTEAVSEAVRTAQIEITRERLRDRKKRETKRFRSKLPCPNQ
jgi:hypothetical protein